MSYTIPNPQDRRHVQTNRNDVSGTIFSSKNINLDEEAYIKLAPASISIMTTADDANFDTADAMNLGTTSFTSTSPNLWVLSNSVFEGRVDYQPLTDISSHSNEPTPSVEDDIVYFNGSEVISDGSTVKYLSASDTWTTIAGTTVSGLAPTRLSVFDGQNGLMIGQGNVVDLINTSWALVRTLTLPNQYQVSTMVSNGSFAFIGTRHVAGGEARLFIWDGNGTSATESYGIENYEIASSSAHGSSIFGASADGRMLRFNGGGFDEISVLPIFMEDLPWGSETNDHSTISNRGMSVDGNQVFITVTSEISGDRRYLTKMVGGVWCFDPSVGLYHRHSPSKTTITNEPVGTGDVDIATDQITVTAAPTTGTPIMFDAGGVAKALIGGLKEGTTYFAIKVDATTIKLATSLTNALTGTAIDLTTTGNASQFLLIYNIFDYGQQFVEDRQSVAVLGSSIYDSRYAGRLAFAADIQTGTIGTTTTSLCTYNVNLPNRGYFVTPRLYSTQKADKYQSLHIKHSPLKPDDEIVVKYRVTDKLNYPHDLTNHTNESVTDLKAIWTSTTTFTTTQDMSDVETDEEVEIVGGSGSGFMAHISSITEDAGTYTITLDEAFIFATASDEFLFVVDNWKKLGSITNTSLESGFRIDAVGGYLQIKVELRGVETKVLDIMINNESYRRLI